MQVTVTIAMFTGKGEEYRELVQSIHFCPDLNKFRKIKTLTQTDKHQVGVIKEILVVKDDN